jgi:hypothetical protein
MFVSKMFTITLLLTTLSLFFLDVSHAIRVKDGNYIRVHANPLFTAEESSRSCKVIDTALAASLNLTSNEREVLPFICLDSTLEAHESKVDGRKPRNGIPLGVQCTPTDWCDSGACTTVCARGSVVVDAWLDNASRLQAQLARSLPFCYATMLGTHNSAITLADGYGNLDPIYQGLFKYIKWAYPSKSKHYKLRTNNQWLSLTDQLNLGVRVVEIDTHWVLVSTL